MLTWYDLGAPPPSSWAWINIIVFVATMSGSAQGRKPSETGISRLQGRVSSRRRKQYCADIILIISEEKHALWVFYYI